MRRKRNGLMLFIFLTCITLSTTQKGFNGSVETTVQVTDIQPSETQQTTETQSTVADDQASKAAVLGAEAEVTAATQDSSKPEVSVEDKEIVIEPTPSVIRETVSGDVKTEDQISVSEVSESVAPTSTQSPELETLSATSDIQVSQSGEEQQLDASSPPETEKPEPKLEEKSVAEETAGKSEDVSAELTSFPKEPQGSHDKGSQKEGQEAEKVEELPAPDTDVETDIEKQPLPVFDDWTNKVREEEEKSKQQDVATGLPSSPVGQPVSKQQKRRYNAASNECGAKILANNPESENAKFILNKVKDEYMINPCKAKKWRARAAFIANEKGLAEENCRTKVDPTGFCVKKVDDNIGNGVFTTKTFGKGQFLLEYRGDLISYKEGRRREILYEGTDVGSFIYFFRHKGKAWCVDATNHIFDNGRMVNDASPGDPRENVSLQVIEVDKRPHLCMFALKDLKKGEELRYDYGLPDLPWRKQAHSQLRLGREGETNDIETERSKRKQEITMIEDRASLNVQAEPEVTTEPESFESASINAHSTSGQLSGEGPDEAETQDNKGEKEKSMLVEDSTSLNLQTEPEVIIESESFRSEPVNAHHQSSFRLKEGGQTKELETKRSKIKRKSMLLEDRISKCLQTEPEKSHNPECLQASSTDITLANSNSIKEKARTTCDRKRKLANMKKMTEYLPKIPMGDIPSSEIEFSELSSGADWIPPSEAEESTDSDMSEVIPELQKTIKSTTPLDVKRTLVYPKQSINTYVSLDVSNPGISVSPEVNIHRIEPTSVEMSSTNSYYVPKSSDSKRSDDKKYFCLYCGKDYFKLERHLTSRHKEEDDVQDLILEKNAEERKKTYQKMRNIGSYLHNCKVTKEGKGELAVRYRPGEQANCEDYGPCPYCYGTFVRRELWRHKCSYKPTTSSRILAASRLLMPVCPDISSQLNAVLANMASGDVSRVAKSDDTIKQFGERLCRKHGHDKDKHNYIRQKLRELSRLLIALREKDHSPNKNLHEYICPTSYRLVESACKAIAEFDEKTNGVSVPTLALKIGPSLRKCARILIGAAIETGNKEKQQHYEEFLKLMDLNWSEEINTSALRTLHEAKKNNPAKLLPLTSDVQRMNKAVKKAAQEAEKSLMDQKGDIRVSWSNLAKSLLAQIIFFNRRRVGGVSKMTLGDYKSICRPVTNTVVEDALSPLEQHLLKCFYRGEITSKRGNIVPVLLTTEMKRRLDLLVSTREGVVPKGNNFLFPRIYYGSLGHLSGCDCIREFASNCGATAPERLRSTRLRKHIATMSQIFNLKNNELDVLAKFMGHDIRVHREYYRLPEETTQVAKVSKILLRMENGGKGLNVDDSLESVTIGEDEETQGDDEDEPDSASESGSDTQEILNGKGDDKEDQDFCIENESTKVQNGQKTNARSTGAEIKGKRRVLKKKEWTEGEKSAVYRHLHLYILNGKVPGKRAIDACIAAEPELQNRNWKLIKYFCKNRITMKQIQN